MSARHSGGNRCATGGLSSGAGQSADAERLPITTRRKTRKSLPGVTECQACGLSVFAERTELEAKALKLQHLKNRLICRVELVAGAGRIQQTGQRSHHTWWPLAAFDILAHCGVETV